VCVWGHVYMAGGEIRHRDYWATVEAFDPKRDM
jgi:hypothetical protein